MERVRWLVAPGAIGLVLLAGASFMAGFIGTVNVLVDIIREGGADDADLVPEMLQALDLYLVAVTLLVAAVGLWELFVADLDVPDSMSVSSLDALKVKVVDLIVLVVVVKYVERFAKSGPSLELLYEALAVGVIALTLIAFTVFKGKG